MDNFGTVLLAGVLMVKPIAPNFRRGGVGGLTNAGAAGIEIWLEAVGLNGAVANARPRLYDPAVLTARPLRFRGFFDGADDFCISKKGNLVDSDLTMSSPLNREASITNDMGAGVSGEGPGEGSVMEEESRETVVVGEDSADSEAEVEVLSRG
jgi:hypothetical protein